LTRNPGTLQNRNHAHDAGVRLANSIEIPPRQFTADKATIINRLLGNAAYKVLGKGAFGFVVSIKNRGSTLSNLRRKLTRVVDSAPLTAREKEVVVKFVFYEPSRPMKRHFAECYRELAVHKHISESCSPIGCFGKKFCGSTLTPLLFFGGADAKTGCFVSVMRQANRQSKTLERWGKITPRLYVTMEMTTAGMLANGIAHNDIHVENVMISPQQVEIIDWGKAAVIPSRIHRCLMKMLLSERMREELVGVIWKECGGLEWQRRLIYERERCAYRAGGDCWGFSEGLLLIQMWNGLTRSERREVMKLKSKMWSCQGGGYMPTPLPLVEKKRRGLLRRLFKRWRI
jgi:predicted Ser/Thr protein kinase